MDFKEIDHLLKLARIELSPQEEEKISSDLQSILDYVRQLQNLNTEGVEPMTGGTLLENVCRADEPGGGMGHQNEELKKAAPGSQGDYFKIPPIF